MASQKGAAPGKMMELPRSEGEVARFLESAFDAYEAKCGEAPSYEALLALSDVVSAGAEQCAALGAFDVARRACDRRTELVAGAGPLWAARPRALTLLRGRAIDDRGCVDKAHAHAIQAVVSGAPQPDEAAKLAQISALATRALDALGDASSVFRGLLAKGDDDEATRRLGDVMARIGEVCGSFGGNVDAALPALHEALTCYDRLPKSDELEDRKVRVTEAIDACLAVRDEQLAAAPTNRHTVNTTEAARALDGDVGRGAILDAYDFAIFVEEADLTLEADSPAAAVTEAVDLEDLFRARTAADASGGAAPARWALKGALAEPLDLADLAADATLHAVLVFRPRGGDAWRVCTHRGYRATVDQLEAQPRRVNVRSAESNAHHPAFFRCDDDDDGDSQASDEPDDGEGITYEQYCKMSAGIKPARARPDCRTLTHVTLTFDDNVARCARDAGPAADAAAALNALPDLHCAALCGDDATPRCANCARMPSPTVAVSRCVKCLRVYYCCRDCQKAHWPTHKKYCSPDGPTEPKPAYVPPKSAAARGPAGRRKKNRRARRYHLHSYDGKDHRTAEKKMQDAVMTQIGMY